MHLGVSVTRQVKHQIDWRVRNHTIVSGGGVNQWDLLKRGAKYYRLLVILTLSFYFLGFTALCDKTIINYNFLYIFLYDYNNKLFIVMIMNDSKNSSN